MRKKFIDPPSGWQYGFPAILEDGKDYKELLIEHGYPEDRIEDAMKWSRTWFQDVDED